MEPNDENKRQLQLLEQLSKNESFIIWRNLVATPRIYQLEEVLKKSDDLPEAILRGSLKHYFSMKDLFLDIFDQTSVALRNIAEDERKDQTTIL